MAIYENTNAASQIASVEFTPVADGNLAFFTLDKPESKDAVKQWLALPDIKQKIVAETLVGDKPVLVTHGDKSKEELMKALETRGDKLTIYEAKKPRNVWPLRAGLSFSGQILNFTSSFLHTEHLKEDDPRLANPLLKEGTLRIGDHVRKPFTWDIGIYSLCNLMANGINFVYGRQETPDLSGERYLKEKLNSHIAPHLAAGATLPTPDDDRKELRQDEEKPPGALQRMNNFLQRNSVYMSEVVLRAAGSLFLLFPVNRVKAAIPKFRNREFIAGFDQALTETRLMRIVGGMNIGGKILNIFAKVPDPYSDKPHTWLDTFREKYLFKIASTIEASSTLGIGYNAYKSKTIGLSPANGGPIKRPPDKPGTDYIGVAGSSLTTGGYLTRILADFGKKKLDTDEIYAHISDSLAQTPKEQLPQLIADCAAIFKEHLNDPQVSLGKIYKHMMTDLYRYHHIPLKSLSDMPADESAKTKDVAKLPEPAIPLKHAADGPRNPLARVTLPSTSHADGITKADEPQVSLGA